jgi:DNA-binding NarL/FixJ family response regulator
MASVTATHPDKTPRPRTRLLLADDHAVVAAGLKALLESSFDLIGVVHDGRALVEADEKLRPDVVLTDISMPLMNGLDAIRQIRARRPTAKIVVLTMHRDTHLAVEAFRAGVSGYLLKVSPGEELIHGIQEVAEGRSFVTTLMAKDLITLLIEAGGNKGIESPLTPRQREVLQLVAEGRTMKEIATLLDISPRTVEAHKYEIMHVLGLQTTAELVQYAMKTKVISD